MSADYWAQARFCAGLDSGVFYVPVPLPDSSGTGRGTGTRRVTALSLRRLERLSEALLDFTAPTDLEGWLKSHARK